MEANKKLNLLTSECLRDMYVTAVPSLRAEIRSVLRSRSDDRSSAEKRLSNLNDLLPEMTDNIGRLCKVYTPNAKKWIVGRISDVEVNEKDSRAYYIVRIKGMMTRKIEPDSKRFELLDSTVEASELTRRKNEVQRIGNSIYRIRESIPAQFVPVEAEWTKEEADEARKPYIKNVGHRVCCSHKTKNEKGEKIDVLVKGYIIRIDINYKKKELHYAIRGFYKDDKGSPIGIDVSKNVKSKKVQIGHKFADTYIIRDRFLKHHNRITAKRVKSIEEKIKIREEQLEKRKQKLLTLQSQIDVLSKEIKELKIKEELEEFANQLVKS